MARKGKNSAGWNWQVRKRKGIKLSDEESEMEKSVDLSEEERLQDEILKEKIRQNRMDSLRSSPQQEESKRAHRIR